MEQQHENHIITKLKWGTLTNTNDCPKCQTDAQARLEAEREKQKQNFNKSIPLHCEICKNQFGFVREGDLNGSYFFCMECKSKPFGI